MIILVKISEKYDQKLVSCSCNIKNTLTTSWFVINILYKRVPKSLLSMPTQVINDLRLHLSWDLGLRTFTWSRESIGSRIIYRFKELGILLFLTKVVKDDINNRS